MLLLVPSHKIDGEDSSKCITSPSRVLVVLPPDTDLSSNVVVPDTAITSTLGTAGPFPSQMGATSDPSRVNSDHLGIWQPSAPEHIHPYHQSTSFPSPGHDLPEHFNKSRRHSHTGLVDTRYGVGNRSRLRQSSHSLPYLYQPTRTPRPLRNAFRQARKDHSPLLTSASLSAQSALSRLSLDQDSDDLSRITRLSASDFQSTRHRLPIGIDRETESTLTDCLGNPSTRSAKLINSSFNIDLDGDYSGKIDPNYDPCPTGPRSIKSSTETTSERQSVNDEIMGFYQLDEKTNTRNGVINMTSSYANPVSRGLSIRKNDANKTSSTECLDIDQDSTLDADMNMILGMTSDMELVMPRFDDEYLKDLRNEPVFTKPCTQSCSFSATSPSCYGLSSTTVSCLSSYSSSKSCSPTPGISFTECGQYIESLPASPCVFAERVQNRYPDVILQTHPPSHSPNLQHRLKADQDLAAVDEADGDSSKHCAERANAYDTAMESSPSSSTSLEMQTGSSPSTLSLNADSEHKSNRPIYFNPRHYPIPERHYGEDQSQRKWTVAPSSQAIGLSPISQESTSSYADGGYHVLQTQESRKYLVPPILDKNIAGTACSGSLTTAGMSILTPQDVQDDYYSRRNHRIHQQRQRRRYSAMAAPDDLSGGAGALEFRTERFLSLARRSSSPDIPHLERAAMPAIGAYPLPASYYLPPSAFRTEADVAAEQEAERKRREQQDEELKEWFLVFPSPILS
ncbi:MAG: hypothetical protein J3Q66DRAFT_16820 [Benniella sp.]|nr:MAG: hypothetical protein J3Q66DRAFT_16820 [Benniella sp.]